MVGTAHPWGALLLCSPWPIATRHEPLLGAAVTNRLGLGWVGGGGGTGWEAKANLAGPTRVRLPCFGALQGHSCSVGPARLGGCFVGHRCFAGPLVMCGSGGSNTLARGEQLWPWHSKQKELTNNLSVV